tara:strand:+ start:1538 stop:2002 length:465 start_codon:yes stop_codon:yes gene_type:complete
VSSCIHCGSDIDADRLEFLVDFNKPLTCKSCSMEPAAKGYVKKPKSKLKKKKKIVKMTQEQHILQLGREEYQRFKDNMQGDTNTNKMQKLLTYKASYYLYVINYKENNEFKPKYDINYKALCVACLLYIKDQTDKLIEDFERGKDELDKYQKVG